MTRDQVIAKIQKLLRLAKSDNPHEAAVAADRARELMLAHDLEEADLSRVASEIGCQAFGKARQKIADWEIALFGAVAHHHDCQALRDTSRGRGGGQYISLIAVGRQSDIAVLRYVYVFLLRQIGNLIDAYCLEHPKATGAMLEEFCLGCAGAIAGKLDQLREDATAAANVAEKSTALVAVKRAAIDKWLADQGWTTAKPKSRKRRMSAAEIEGWVAAQNIEIRAAVAANLDRAAIAGGR